MAEEAVNETAVSQANAIPEASRKPIVLKLKKEKKKKKRRSSSGLKDVQVRARSLSKARLKIRKAAVKGSLAFRKRSKKSAKKKRDGAVRDLLPNIGWALSRTMRSASGVPYDVAKALDKSGPRRGGRRLRLSGGRRVRRVRLLAFRAMRRRRRRMQTRRMPSRRLLSRRRPSRRLRLMALRRVRGHRNRRGSQRMLSRRWPSRRLGLMAVRTRRSSRRRSLRPLLLNRMRNRRSRRSRIRRMPLRPLGLSEKRFVF
jgi:hypothetical protein